VSSSAHPASRFSGTDVLAWAVGSWSRPLHALMAMPSLLFLTTLALMLFHPPDFHLHSIDRMVLGVLTIVVLLRACVLRKPLTLRGPLTWPMLAMLLLAFCGALAQPSESETWSLFAAKWFVPFILYHLAAYVFDDARSLRQFETFCLIVLAYLSLMAIFFLFDLKEFIFPRYILDEGLGIHADRARGPFLQAVANGVALNLLGLIALNSFRRRRIHVVVALLFLTALPLAIVATKTRAVWLSFAGSILLLLFVSPSRRLRRVCLAFMLAGSVALLAVVAWSGGGTALSDRLEERGPVEFRMAVYQAGWEMFLEKPIAGWGATDMQAGLSRRISNFHQENFFFHNTYLEIAVQYGLVGLALYSWIVFDLFKLGRALPGFSAGGSFLDGEFRMLWPVLLGVYFLNGAFVVMNYQFVNGFLFALAGLLVAQNRRHEDRGSMHSQHNLLR
jgi:O-antigen ligase